MTTFLLSEDKMVCPLTYTNNGVVFSCSLLIYAPIGAVVLGVLVLVLYVPL